MSRFINIDIYHSYSVNINSVSSSWSEDSTRDDVEFVDNKSTEHFYVEGGEFLDLIARWITNRDISSVEIYPNKLFISMFDPMTGCSNDFECTWEQLEES